MSTPAHQKGRTTALKLILEGLVIIALIGLFLWVWQTNRTQHQICQLVRYAGIQNQNGIDTNSALVLRDNKLGTAAAKSDARIRRTAIKKATDAQIIINRIQC